MLETTVRSFHLGESGETPPVSRPIGLYLLIQAVRRHIFLVIAGVLFFLAIGVGYIAAKPALYVGVAQLLVDNRKIAFGRADALFTDSQPDTSFVESQVEILQSEKIALRVIDRLDLTHDEEFATIEPGLKTRILEWFGQEPEPPTEERMHLAALSGFRAALDARRVRLSYVVEVSFLASTPQKSAAIANEVARAYMDDQTEASAEAAQHASAWLRDRIENLGPHARIISPAVPREQRVGTNSIIILGLSAGLGLIFGLGAACARELLDRTIRTPEQIVASGAIECLGMVPRIRMPRVGRTQPAAAQDPATRLISTSDRRLSWVLGAPFSALWHTLRRIRVAADAASAGAGVRLGVTSVTPREGKTTIAANLAQMIASTGQQVLLVDLDPYHPTLSDSLASASSVGLIDVLEQKVAFQDSVWVDERTKLHFIPIGASANRHLHLDVIGSDAAAAIFKDICSIYDYVILDLPPLTPAADARAAAQLLDGIVLVVESGRRVPEEVSLSLLSAGPVQDKLLGAVLNKVDRATLKQHHYP